MPKKKDPFVNYPMEQILEFEDVLYFIQVGEEVFQAEDQWFFDYKTAVDCYNKILKEILYQLKHGTRHDKRRARSILLDFRVVPLKMH